MTTAQWQQPLRITSSRHHAQHTHTQHQQLQQFCEWTLLRWAPLFLCNADTSCNEIQSLTDHMAVGNVAGSCLVAGGTICCQRSYWFLLSEHVSPEQSWSLTVRPRANALIHSSAEPRFQLGCSGLSLPSVTIRGFVDDEVFPSSPCFEG